MDCSRTLQRGLRLLRPDTQLVWDYLKSSSALNGFVLVGGTALSIHLDHRLSEDLDFMYPDHQLPHQQVELLKRTAAQDGLPFESKDNPVEVEEFEESGNLLRDFQQDFLVGETVRLTLVAPESEIRKLLTHDPKSPVRVATLAEVFRLKCLACADRTKSRDWLDMYVMLERGLFPPYEVYRTFELAGATAKFDIAMMRMCDGKLQPTDEGYASLLDSPPSINEMQAFFREMKEQIEVEVTRRRISLGHVPP